MRSNSPNSARTHNKAPEFSQPTGRLRLGCGQAGHSTASPPWGVPSTPDGSCPSPARFRDSMFRQRQKTRCISGYRYYKTTQSDLRLTKEKNKHLQLSDSSPHYQFFGSRCGRSQKGWPFPARWVHETYQGIQRWRPSEDVQMSPETIVRVAVEHADQEYRL